MIELVQGFERWFKWSQMKFDERNKKFDGAKRDEDYPGFNRQDWKIFRDRVRKVQLAMRSKEYVRKRAKPGHEEPSHTHEETHAEEDKKDKDKADPQQRSSLGIFKKSSAQVAAADDSSKDAALQKQVSVAVVSLKDAQGGTGKSAGRVLSSADQKKDDEHAEQVKRERAEKDKKESQALLRKKHHGAAKKGNDVNAEEQEMLEAIIKRVGEETYWVTEFMTWDWDNFTILDVLLENWPAKCRVSGEVDDNIVIIDIFTCSEEKLQDQLTRTMMTINDAGIEDEIGGRQAEKKRLTQAWRMSHLLRYNARWQKRYADLLQGAIISLTFFAIITSVVYSHYTSLQTYRDNGGVPVLTPQWESVLVNLNLILPLAVTVFRGIFAFMNPSAKYLAFKTAAIRVESEIYLYRAKVSGPAPQ